MNAQKWKEPIKYGWTVLLMNVTWSPSFNAFDLKVDQKQMELSLTINQAIFNILNESKDQSLLGLDPKTVNEECLLSFVNGLVHYNKGEFVSSK